MEEARAVIVGTGIAGSSIAYHLAELGWRDLIVLDQGPLRSGTTSHAPGLVGQLRSSATLTQLLRYSVSLYKELEIDGVPGFSQMGSLRLASSTERLEELKRQAGWARTVGLEAELITAAEALRLFPLMSSQDLCGALYFPTDGSARALVLAQALAARARKRGVVFQAETPVVGVDVSAGQVQAVITSKGRIRTNVLVVATGIWSRRLGRLLGVSIPLIPMQHQYVATTALEELDGVTLPNIRDPDRLVYLRQDEDSLVLGGYERECATFGEDSIPTGAHATVRDFDASRFAPLLEAGRSRFPLLEEAELVKKVNGLESFTPDGEFVLGEASEVRGFWVACGFCAHGVSGGGGVGKALAEWIVTGEPSLDMWQMDIRRFSRHAASRRFVLGRASEVYRTYYDIHYPGEERESVRNLRLSPLYGRLEKLGAVFGEKNGWERPNWFVTNEPAASAVPAGARWPEPKGWARRCWSTAIGVEHQATRARVALFDETSFAKIEVYGYAALSFLQRITTNEMDRPFGSITYTQMLNRRGGIECDLTVTRLGGDRFQLITGTAFGPHDLSWIRSHLPDDGSVHVRDITASLCTIGVWGPRARELVQSVSDDDFSNDAFPYMTARPVTIGEVPTLACRVTYVGELGWELYAPSEYGLRLWDRLWEAGVPLGVVAAGYRAIDSLRLEKGYRYWSADIDAEHHPWEAGMKFSVRLKKGDFIGKTALERIQEAGVERKLCCLTLDDPSHVVLGGEPILDPGAGDGVVGRVTSGGYGYTVRESIAYGYLPVRLATPGTSVAVELFGERCGAKVVEEPLYDPRGERIRS